VFNKDVVKTSEMGTRKGWGKEEGESASKSLKLSAVGELVKEFLTVAAVLRIFWGSSALWSKRISYERLAE